MEKVHNWCMRNKGWTISIGLFMIFFGLIIDQQYGGLHLAYISAIFHLLVILGEAIVVMFFLHVIVEEQNYQEHVQQTGKVLSEIQNGIVSVVEQQASFTETQFRELIQNIKDDLFAAILRDKMPADMVRQILDSDFFRPTFLRRNLKVQYLFRENKSTELVVEQKIEFDMQYVIGQGLSINYEMPFSLSDSPLASYRFLEAGVRRYIDNSSANMGPPETFTENDFDKKEFGNNNEKDYFALKKPIPVNKNETIHVYQHIVISFSQQSTGIVDNYFVNHHTLRADIEIEFPEEYEFTIYPTFPEESLPQPIKFGKRKVYENIRFMIPGHGWGYSILKKS